MSGPGLSEGSAKDPLVKFLEEEFAGGGEVWIEVEAEAIVAAIRSEFFVMKREDYDFQMQCINNFQTDLKQQIRDEIAVENGTYRERD